MAMKRSNIFDPIQKELDQKVFNGITPRPRVIKFIEDEYAKVMTPILGFNPLEFSDLYLTGSLTTYQYGDTSDCDVSVFVQWDLWPTGEDPNQIRRHLIPPIMNKLDGTMLPGTKHPIQHFIVPPGTRPEDLYKPGLRSAWSFRDKSWIVPPEKDRVHDISVELPVLYHRAEMMADKMEELLAVNPIYAKEFWHQIHRKRSLDQQAGLGDFSEGNIIYKYLLHNGYFDRIRDELGEKISKVAAVIERRQNSTYPDEGPILVDQDKNVWIGWGFPDHEDLWEQMAQEGATNTLARAEITQGKLRNIDNIGGRMNKNEAVLLITNAWTSHISKIATGLPGEPYVPQVGEIWTISNPFAGAMPHTLKQPRKQSFEVLDVDDDEIWLRDVDSHEERQMSMADWHKLVWRGIAYRRNQDWQLQQTPEEAADLWPDTIPEKWSTMGEPESLGELVPSHQYTLWSPRGLYLLTQPGALPPEGAPKYLTYEGELEGKLIFNGVKYDPQQVQGWLDKKLLHLFLPPRADMGLLTDPAELLVPDTLPSNWSMVREADTQRLFLAYELPEQIVAQVIQWQEQNLPEGVHPEPATNLHMTIAFLGDTDTAMIPGLQQILGEIDPSQVVLNGPIEYRELEKLAFLALQDNGGNEIVEQINEKLGALMGYEPQFRPWLPHITVWRFAPDHKPNLQPQLPNFGSFTPLGVHVYTSVKNPAGGGTYQKVAAEQPWEHDPGVWFHITTKDRWPLIQLEGLRPDTDVRRFEHEYSPGVYLFGSEESAYNWYRPEEWGQPIIVLRITGISEDQVQTDPEVMSDYQGNEWEEMLKGPEPYWQFEQVIYPGVIPPSQISIDSGAGEHFLAKTADDLSWVDKSTPYGTPDGGFIGGPEHPGDDPIGDQPKSLPPRDDWQMDKNDTTLKIIYDFDRDQIILGDQRKAEQFPPGQIIGEYRHPDVYLTDHATAWFNPSYFKRLWTHSFPKRPIRHVVLDKSEEGHEVVHHGVD